MSMINKADIGSEMVLLVDDSPDNLVVMKKVIQKVLPNLEIATLQEPGKVMDFLRTSDVSAIVSDLQMPGMDGIELCRTIKGSDDTQHIPVILITSHDADPGLKVRGLDAGADDFLMRPMDNSELVARVKVALRISRAERKLQNKLLVSDKTLQAIFENSQDGILMIDIESKKIKLGNPKISSMLGYSLPELVTLSVKDIHLEEDFPIVAETFGKQISAEESLASNIPIKRRDGSIFYADINASSITLDDCEYMVGSFRDVTERKKAEKEMLMLKAAVEQIPVGIAMADADLQLYFCNAAGIGLRGDDCKLVGISKEEYANWQVLKLNGDIYEPDRYPLMRAITEGVEINEEFLVRHQDGSDHLCDAVAVPVLSEDNEIVGGVIIFPDITERRQMEKELQEVSEEFANIFNMSLDLICIADINESTFLKVNPAFTNLLGYDESELINHQFSEFTHADDIEPTMRVVEDQLRQGKKVVDFTNRYQCKDGTWVWLEWVSHPAPEKGISYAIAHDVTERKLAEQKLQDAYEYLGSIVNRIGDPVFVKDANFKFVLANDALCEFMGTAREQLIGTTAAELLPADQMNHFLKTDRKVLETGEEDLSEELLSGHDGQIRTIVTKKTLYTDAKDARFIVGVIRDVTDSKQSEDSLRKSEEFLNQTGDLALVGGWHIDLGAMKVLWTRTTGKIHELPEGYFPDLEEAFNYYHPDDQREVRQCIERAIEEGEPFDFTTRLITAKGNERWVRSIGYPVFDSGKCVELSGAFQDVTERKLAELRLVALKKRNQALLDHSPACHKIVDLDSRLRYMNASGFRMLKLEESDNLYGKPYPFDFFPDASRSRLTAELQKVIEADERISFEDIACDSDGNEVWLHHNMIPVHKDDGSLDYITVVSADITERRRDEDILRRTSEQLLDANNKIKETYESSLKNERLNALGQMAGGISHDFNNVLMPILGISDLMLTDAEILDDRAETIASLETIRDAARDAQSIVRRLRQIYKPDYIENQVTVDLASIVENAVLLTKPKWMEEAHAKGIDILIETDMLETPTIEGNATELREVIVNIVCNAVDAMDDSGTISFRTRTEDSKSLVLEISDTGKGMDEDLLAKCMDAFFTTKGSDGTGLGLSMVHGIVQRHNGAVSIDSVQGRGTTVSMTFPVSTGSKGLPVKEETEDSEVSAMSILIIEDDARSRAMIERLLKIDGHRVQACEEGSAGIQAFQEHAFDLVITDRAMPGMSGDEVAKEISKISPDTPVIMLTGFGDIMKDNEDHPTGVSEIMTKPVSLRNFRNVISSVISPQKKEL